MLGFLFFERFIVGFRLVNIAGVLYLTQTIEDRKEVSKILSFLTVLSLIIIQYPIKYKPEKTKKRKVSPRIFLLQIRQIKQNSKCVFYRSSKIVNACTDQVLAIKYTKSKITGVGLKRMPK